VLVCKTITFDSGGISIKPGKGMEWMKFDKSGGMAVLAAMLAAARLRLPVPVVGLLAVAENMPGGGATRPGDVIATRSGRTVEIVNTDAEGRLVLADALDYAAGLKPRAIVDLATLTGAAVTALGHVASPVMANHEPLLRALGEAGTRAGERLWPLPLFDDYAPMLRSPFADCRNIGDGTAGTIAGGMFLREFVPDAIPWAHIDITHAWEENERGHTPVGATLFGAALLVEWLRSLNP
jgi:leucyl aminopeptidase